MRLPRHGPTALTAALLLGLGLTACGDDDGPAAAGPATTSAPAATAPPPDPAPPATAPAEPAPDPAPEPLPGLPADTAGFDGWTRLNAGPIPPDSPQAQRVGFDAHGGTKNVYVNVPRGRIGTGAERFPDGAVVVKAAGAGGEITLVAIMRKVAGSDPEHGDWRFVEYKRGGAGEAFATDAGLRDATCWGCHATATPTDWVFTALE